MLNRGHFGVARPAQQNAMADAAAPAAKKQKTGERTVEVLERTIARLVESVINAREEHPSAIVLKCLQTHAKSEALAPVFLNSLLVLAESGDGFDALREYLADAKRISAVLDAVHDDERSAALFRGVHDVLFSAADDDEALAEKALTKAALGAGAVAVSTASASFVEGIASLISSAQHNAAAMREAAACVLSVARAVKDERALPCVEALVTYSLRHHMKCSCEKTGPTCVAYDAAADALHELLAENVASARDSRVVRDAIKVLKRQDDERARRLCALVREAAAPSDV